MQAVLSNLLTLATGQTGINYTVDCRNGVVNISPYFLLDNILGDLSNNIQINSADNLGNVKVATSMQEMRNRILVYTGNDRNSRIVGMDLWEWAFGIGKSLKIAWDKLFYVASALKDIRNLTLEDMANLIYQLRGLEHRQATFASGELTLTGTDTVTLGNIFATKDGLQFKALETKEITESGTVKAECLTAGKIGNVPVGQITEFVTYKGNFTAVTNVTAFSGGYAEETKEELYDRYISVISEPIVSGNDNLYKKEILNVAGVGKVKIKPLWNGDNTVKGIILGNDGEPASDSLVSAVQDYIDP